MPQLNERLTKAARSFIFYRVLPSSSFSSVIRTAILTSSKVAKAFNERRVALFVSRCAALQRLHDPCVAQADLVLLRQLLVKMTHVQVEALLPVQIQNLLGSGLRHPLAARHTTPTIQQSIVATHLIALPPATKLPVADTDDFCNLPSHDLPRAGP